MNRLKQLVFLVTLLIPISSHIEPKVFRAPADVVKHDFIYKTLLKVLDPDTASGSVNVEFLDKLARDLYELVFNRDIDLIKDPYLTTALMISTLYSESRLKELSDHDSTNPNWCLMQINLGITASGRSVNRVIVREDGKYAISKHEGHDGPSLERDQRACLNVGLAFLKESWRMCSKYPESHRLSVYLSGSCSKSRRASTFRFQRALSLSETLMALHMKDQLTRNTQVCYNTK